MSRKPRVRARLAGALLLALALPLSAQAPEGEAPADDVADPAAEAAPADDGQPMPTDLGGTIGTGDPAVLDAEAMPRAARSLLLDVTRTNAGFFAVGERGHVVVSEDGQAWRQAAIPTRATLTTITSVDGVLWAAGHDGVIVHSTDGGQTWTRRRASPWSYDLADPSEGVPVLDLLFTDPLNGFAIGAYSLMLVTADGGVTWAPRQVFAGDDDAAPAEAAPAPDGEDWTFDADDLVLDAESDPHLNAMARTGSGALVIAGERGTFLRSRDGGATWESRRLPYEGSMFGILAWDGDHILAFGLRGNVYESRNLGDSWTRVETGTTTSLMGGAALPDGGAVLVGGNGLVLRRASADAPFEAATFENAAGESPLLSAVMPAGDAGFLVVGDKGAGLHRPQ